MRILFEKFLARNQCQTLEALAFCLTAEYGNGYTLTNLKYMRQFYLAFPIGHALRDELSWSNWTIGCEVLDCGSIS